MKTKRAFGPNSPGWSVRIRASSFNAVRRYFRRSLCMSGLWWRGIICNMLAIKRKIKIWSTKPYCCNLGWCLIIWCRTKTTSGYCISFIYLYWYFYHHLSSALMLSYSLSNQFTMRKIIPQKRQEQILKRNKNVDFYYLTTVSHFKLEGNTENCKRRRDTATTKLL